MAGPTSSLSPHLDNRNTQRRRILFASATLFVLALLAVLAGWIFFHGLVPPASNPFIGDYPEASLIREWETLRRRYLIPHREPIFDALVLSASLLLVTLVMGVRRSLRRCAANRRQVLARYESELETKEFLKVKNDLRTGDIQLLSTTAQIIGGFVLLCGIYFAWGNLVATREGQITDRFIRAIDQLGAIGKDGKPQREIRLGGIYGLERIARESAEDEESIRDIFIAYIRVNAPWTGDNAASKEGQTVVPATENRVRPQVDIQTALTFLVQPPTSHLGLDLSGVDLRGVALGFADLQWAILNDADLDSATMTSAQITFAQLRGTHLKGADLMWTQMTGAYLGFSHLEGADLRGARLDHAYLFSAHLDGAFLNVASLDHASFGWASLTGTHLGDTDLSRAEGLTQKQVDSAYGNLKTKLPFGIHMPESWRTKGDDWSVGISQRQPDQELKYFLEPLIKSRV
jgi:pentapeptide repeat protein